LIRGDFATALGIAINLLQLSIEDSKWILFFFAGGEDEFDENRAPPFKKQSKVVSFFKQIPLFLSAFSARGL
jgi:hypothetical protein